MKQEEILKQAEEYAYKVEHIDSTHKANEWNGYGKHHIKQAFEAGADWRIKSVWHDASEFPSRYSSVLISSDVRRPYIMKPINREHWAKYIEHNCVKLWAYASDLLPQEKGEEK